MSTAQATTAPIVRIAAAAVIILSAVGVGAMTGLIPGVPSQDKPAQTAEAPAALAPATNTAEPAKRAPPKPAAKEPVKVAAAAPACLNCGVVTSVEAVEVQGEASGAGAVIGGVAGLVVGNQIGKGKGKTLAKIAGAAGGAYAGHQIEKNTKKAVEYRITVRLNDGSVRTLAQPSDNGLTAGTRVKIVDDRIVRES